MKKAYSHLAALVLAAASLSSCSRADYTANTAATSPLTASVAQAPAASPAADYSAQVIATKPQPATVVAAPVAAPAPVVAAAPVATPAAPSRVAAAPVAVAASAAAPAEAPAARATKPTLAQRLAVNKLTKQLSKIEQRQQNTASTTETAARSGSITILLVGVIALLLGIIFGASWLGTIGGVLILIGLVLLLLKAL